MKPTAVLDMHRTGDLGGNKVTMKIDENSLAHVMSLLTDLYSDPELAVIREYSTNARDSHIMAGVDRAIEVTLPNQMSPYFKVKDFGLGMDIDDIEETYSKYGASTKRGSNDANGMLGLGCKSALTYTSQFTISAVKDGKKSIVVVSRVEDGTGVMEIVSTSDTTEPNGVEISVPVKQGNRFQQKATNFFRFWEPGTALVNGETIEKIKGLEIAPNLYVVKNIEDDVIVMGGVSYPVPGGLYDAYRSWNSFKVVAFVEIGEVNFTPSRESLSMTPLTKATVAKVKQEFVDKLRAAVLSNVAESASPQEAVQRYVNWKSLLGSQTPADVFWKGQKVLLDYTGDFTYWNGRSGRYSVSQSTSLDYRTLTGAVIVLGYDRTTEKNLKGITPTQKKKIHALLNETYGVTTSGRGVVLGLSEPGSPWMKYEHVLQWDDVLAHKLPKAAPKGAKPEPTYTLYSTTTGYVTIEQSKIDRSKPIHYVSPRERHGRDAMSLLTPYLGDATIVVMGENRWEKFLRDFPTATSLHPAVVKLAKSAEDGLTPQDKENLGMDYYDKTFLSGLDAIMIDDPDVKVSISMAKGLATTSTLSHYEKVAKVVQHFGVRVSRPSAASVLGKYPLVSGGNPRNKTHAVIYMNAVYAANQNGAI